jgi:hypothetical protein
MKFKVMEYGKEGRTELLCKDKYKNYNYYVLNLGTHPTAYIEIPKENKLYRKSYDEIYKIGCDIDVHGGDYCGYEENMPESIRVYGKKWTTEEIIEECKNAIGQIIDFESKEILEEPKKIEKIDFRTLNTQKEKNRAMKDTINELIDEIDNLKGNK